MQNFSPNILLCPAAVIFLSEFTKTFPFCREEYANTNFQVENFGGNSLLKLAGAWQLLVSFADQTASMGA